MPMPKPANLISSIIVLLLFSASVVLGQTGTSGISGTVRDTNGAVVANATVTRIVNRSSCLAVASALDKKYAPIKPREN